MEGIKYIIVDYKMPKSYLKIFKDKNINIVRTKALNIEDKRIDGHPDLAVHQVDNNRVYVEKSLLDYYKRQLKGIEVFPSYKSLGSEYPHNIGLNIFRYKNIVFHNIKYMDENIRAYYEDRRYNMVNVKQGYTKCSIAYIHNKIITSDTDIYNKASKYLDCLLIKHKEVALKGYEYGFIGGASGCIGNSMLFTGVLSNHSSKETIENFAKKNFFEIKYLSQNPIEDFGSILSIY